MVLDQNIFPYTKYTAWVQALTNNGIAPSSEHLDVLTKQAAPSSVTKLAVKEASANELVISWEAPNFPNGIIHHYEVTYRCLQYLACGRNVSCNESHGRLESSTTNITLKELYPHSQYLIEVHAFTVESGPSFSLVTATLSSRPDAAPEASEKPIVQKTTNSLMLTWEPVADCRKLNGYPGGYHIALYRKVDDTYKLVHAGYAITPPVKFYGLLPNRVYELNVRQLVTDNQYNPFYKLVITAETAAKLTPVAQNITVGNLTSHSIDIKWHTEKQSPHTFLVTYKCVRILSCPEQDTQGCSSTISIVTKETQVTIKELHPYTRYIVLIKIFGDEPSETAFSGFTTSAEAPGVSPVMALEPTRSHGVTWAEIQWAPPDDCTLLYGIFTGYKVELIHRGEKILEDKCNASIHSMNFTDLQPYSDYDATVRVIVSTEDNKTEIISDEFLRIKFKTKAPAPEAVEGLEVYGRGSNHLALRFKTPDYLYGTIDSLVIEYEGDYGIRAKAQMVARRCPLWPDLTCATIADLFPHVKYTVTVHPWCSEQKEEGASATITATTIEEAPGPPAFVQIVNKTDTSFTVKWGFPTMLNGVFRGFLIEYLQISSAVPDLCCNDSGVLNISSAVETTTYLTQVSGLLPASGYMLEVRAVTIKPGEPLTYRDSTLPTTPQLKLKPEVIRESITATTAVIEIKQQTDTGSPISAFFMAVYTPYEVNVGNFFKENVQHEFQELLGPKAYIAFELHPIDVELSFKVTLGTGARYAGRFGRFFNTPLDPDTTYRVEFLAMSAFADRRVYGRISSDTFHTRPFSDLRIPTGHLKSAYGHTNITDTASVLDNSNKGIQEDSEQENNELEMQSQEQCVYIIPKRIELSKSEAKIGETSHFNTSNSEYQLSGLASERNEQVHGINKTEELQGEGKDKMQGELHLLKQCRNSKSISIEYPKGVGNSVNKSQNSNNLRKHYQKIHFQSIKYNKIIGQGSKNIRNITKG
ncbi:protein sidekick-1-like isoform X1 [Anabrus simplex]|uniref:protein sidekick-1-like isoform X1 n=1 Tax=Anabrus simplex TaxID=316456 RepID=UPI0035A38436